MEQPIKESTNMRQLLEKWAEVEPGRCKRETRDFYVTLGDNNFYLVITDSTPGGYCPSKEAALARVQWATQQAIIARGWYFELIYSLEYGYEATVGESDCTSQDNMAEALLSAYLAAIEA